MLQTSARRPETAEIVGGEHNETSEIVGGEHNETAEIVGGEHNELSEIAGGELAKENSDDQSVVSSTRARSLPETRGHSANAGSGESSENRRRTDNAGGSQSRPMTMSEGNF